MKRNNGWKTLADILCFSGAVLLCVLCVAAAVCLPAASTHLFEKALIKTVDMQYTQTNEQSLSVFAEETMDYLLGRTDAWKPSIMLFGRQAETVIAPSFTAHMATVRSWVSGMPLLFGIGLGAALLCLGSAMLLHRFRKRVCYEGMAFVGTAAAAVLLFAAVDFDRLWMLIHRLFITDGIFSAREPIMQLFPETLFMSYIPPVVILLLVLPAGLAGLFAGLEKLSADGERKRL